MKSLLRRAFVMGIVALFLVAIGAAYFKVNIRVEAAGAIVYVDDDNVAGPWDGTVSHPYENITSGVEHALYGDTVYVFSGTYAENVVVNKSITLRGDSKPRVDGIGGTGIEVTVYDDFLYGVTVDGFDITNCSYGITLAMQHIVNVVTDVSVVIGDIILINNTISSNSDGIVVDVHNVGVDVFGNSSVVVGDFRVANNFINSSGKGVNVAGFHSIGFGMFNSSSFSMGNLEITGNTVDSSQQGIYLYRIASIGNDMSDNSSFTMGSILVNDNTVNSDDYGIEPWILGGFGAELYGDSSYTMGNIEFCRNTVNSTKDAIGFNNFGGSGADMYGNSSFSMGNVLVNDNTLYSFIWLATFGYFGEFLYENASCTMGNVEFSRNEIYISLESGITFYGLKPFGYRMYNYSRFEMGDFSVNDNVIQCNSTRSGIACPGGNGGFGLSVYDDAVAVTGSFEFEGNDISSGWTGISLYSVRNATVRNNMIGNCTYGMWVQDSVDNTVYSNKFYGNGYGIYLVSSSNNDILGNNITSSLNPGIFLSGSSSNIISGNTIENSQNEHIELLYSSNNNVVSGNTLTNSTADVGIYVYLCALNSFFGNNITSNADTGIRLDVSSDSAIYENNISGNLNGVVLWYSWNITVSGNDMLADNGYGVVLDNSDNNLLNGNTIADSEYGVSASDSSGNKLYQNNFINNTVQANVTPNYNNTWDNGFPSGGNYWSDYLTRYPNATEIDHTGIGDTAYEIDENNTDHYPLMIAYKTTPPTITILSPENKTYAVNASIPLTFTVDEFASWMGYSLDGQANVTIAGNVTLPTLPDGWHWVTVYANDTFGNMGSATVHFTVDTTAPSITNVVQDPLTDVLPDTVVRINATVTDATSGTNQVILSYTTGGGTWIPVEMTNLEGETWNATIPAFSYGTNVTYVIDAEDNAANTITTKQIYGYEYEYPVVPEVPLVTVLTVFFVATSLLAVITGKKKTLAKKQDKS